MFKDLWREIDEAPDDKLPRIISQVAQKYDDLILEFKMIPVGGVDFLVKIFSSERILNSKGIEHFLLEMNVDWCKYAPDQREIILKTLISNAKRVVDELGRHSIGDFIARAFPVEIALREIVGLSIGDNNEKHIAIVGLDVLKMRAKDDIILRAEIEKKWSEMFNITKGK